MKIQILLVAAFICNTYLAHAQLFAPEIKVENTPSGDSHFQGKVGIGISTPLEVLDARGSIRIPANEQNNSPETCYGIVSLWNDQAFVWDQDGSGTYYPANYLKTYGIGFYRLKKNATVTNGVAAYMSGHFGVDFFVRNQLAMRIDWEYQRVGIGVASPSQKLHVNGNVLANNVQVSSDRKLKKNIEDYDQGLAVVRKIHTVRYQLKAETDSVIVVSELGKKEKKAPAYIGVIAQELQQVAPDLVHNYMDDTGEEILAIDHTALTFLLVNAVKELNATVEQQQQVIAELQEQLKKK